MHGTIVRTYCWGSYYNYYTHSANTLNCHKNSLLCERWNFTATFHYRFVQSHSKMLQLLALPFNFIETDVCLYVARMETTYSCSRRRYGLFGEDEKRRRRCNHNIFICWSKSLIVAHKSRRRTMQTGSCLMC
jgi:hypothetical protein